ncbi:MAG: alpha-ketoacid dehydrogenase subunit beta [Candidatus Micrarchaeota archaeon]|nr:alpha-ketoacid dehydrogenase subunit beta [Candidatus Micrarchaeota archaeon]
MMLMNMVGALNNALSQILAENPNAIIMGEDVGKDGGVFRVTDGLQAKFGPGRVMDTPLAESMIIGTAIGMALSGMRPIAEVQFAGFMYMGYDQIVNHAARYRSRTRSAMSVPMIVRTPISGGVRTLEHHSDSPETLYAHIGGLVVLEPSTPYDAKGLLIAAAHGNDPVIFLEPTKLYRLFKQDVPEEMYEVPIGKANLVAQGESLTIVTHGTMVPMVKSVVEKKKVSADIIDLRTISPLDEQAILDSAKKTGRVVIVHEAPLSFGPGAEIAARIAEKAIFELQAPIVRVASGSFPYPFPAYETYYMPNEQRIGKAIDKVLQA